MDPLAAQLPPIVIDLGSGFTKLGYAGNMEPNFVIPTALLVRDSPMGTTRKSGLMALEDLDFTIGDDLTERPGYCNRNDRLFLGFDHVFQPSQNVSTSFLKMVNRNNNKECSQLYFLYQRISHPEREWTPPKKGVDPSRSTFFNLSLFTETIKAVGPIRICNRDFF
ncbi:hypothetical protein ACOME3_001657 [Neoechinorhynchus agilis]